MVTEYTLKARVWRNVTIYADHMVTEYTLKARVWRNVTIYNGYINKLSWSEPANIYFLSHDIWCILS